MVRSRLLASTALLAVLAVATLSLAAAPALAHSAIAPAEAPAGVPTEFTLTVPHGCAPGEPPPAPGEQVAPTTEIALRLPPGASLEEAAAPPGWNADPSTAEGRDIIAWTGGRLAPEEAGRFTFTATLYGGEGDQVPLEVFQGCTEGAYRWIQVPGEDGDRGDLDQPAPVVLLTSTAAAPAAGDDGAPDGGAAGEPDTAPGTSGSDGSVDGSGSTPAGSDAAAPADDTAAGDGATPDAAAAGGGQARGTGAATGDGETEAADGDGETDDAAAAAGGEADDPTGGPPTAVWAVGGLVLAGAVGAGLWRLRAGGTGSDRPRGGSGATAEAPRTGEGP